MTSKVNFGIRDYSDETGQVAVYFPDVSSANYDGVLGSGVGARYTNVKDAILGVTLGNLAQVTKVAASESPNNTRPASPFAQRESGLRLYYRDTVTDALHTLTIPAPDLASVATAGTDIVALADIQALVDTLELEALTPNGNALTVESALIVGRNN